MKRTLVKLGDLPGKGNPPGQPTGHAGGLGKKPLAFFLLRGRSRLRGLGLGHALLEFIHAPGGIDELLLAGVEGMAGVAYTDNYHRLRGTGLDYVAARATNLRIHVFRMNLLFHKRQAK